MAETIASQFTTGKCEGGISPKHALLNAVAMQPLDGYESKWFLGQLLFFILFVDVWSFHGRCSDQERFGNDPEPYDCVQF